MDELALLPSSSTPLPPRLQIPVVQLSWRTDVQGASWISPFYRHKFHTEPQKGTEINALIY